MTLLPSLQNHEEGILFFIKLSSLRYFVIEAKWAEATLLGQHCPGLVSQRVDLTSSSSVWEPSRNADLGPTTGNRRVGLAACVYQVPQVT